MSIETIKKSTISLKLWKLLLLCKLFEGRHKVSDEVFTRNRKLPFLSIIQILLRKSVKSLQLVLNEWSDVSQCRITPSAFTQGRKKICHTAFIELLERCVVEVMYADKDYKTLKGHRLLALDGSTLRVPNTIETREHFGIIPYVNGKKSRKFDRVEAKMTVLYDVLNDIPISAKLATGRMNDIKASRAHLKDLIENDIVICDRAFGSYRFFEQIKAAGADFVVRCKNRTFQKYHGLTRDSETDDVTVLIQPSGYLKQGQEPETMRVRFLKIILPSGEVEILATSLLCNEKFRVSDFREIYKNRWQIETYFQVLKSRLCIDNFTGKSVESIYQDFYATIFISGIETILTVDANEQLAQKETRHLQKVNKAVSFHLIKNTVIKLMYQPPHDFEQKITELFMQNPTSVRPNRKKAPRNRAGVGKVKSLSFQRYARKHIF